MDRRALINAYRLGFAVLTIVAITAQAYDLYARDCDDARRSLGVA